jgi:hypothetical protein
MVHVSVQVVSSYVTLWLSNTCLILVISFVITLYLEKRALPVFGLGALGIFLRCISSFVWLQPL